MPESRTCPRCGAELPADSPEQPCPACLIKLGLESWTAGENDDPVATPTEHMPAGFEAPSVEELAPRFPQLEILELIGKGGMGAVYKARQKSLDRFVALKIINPHAADDPNFAERFAREARSLARLSHPNIITVHDFGEAGGLFYFLMEYVEGANIRQLLRAGTLKPQEALQIIPPLCDALQYAHDEGIIHRDVKPENILVDTKGRVKIADFGLAKLMGKDHSDVTLTAAHQAMGTLHYMAPEQMERPLEVDHRADIYSLGVTIYEMLTGELPLGRYVPPSQKVQVDVRLDEVVLKALERQPARRYQHASDVKTAVETISREQRIDPGDGGEAPRVSDHVLAQCAFRLIFFPYVLWAAVLLVLHWGYLSGAVKGDNWYFQEELPYRLLTGAAWWLSLWLIAYLTWWWYLVAKRPDVPRSFGDFFTTLQRPDPRAKRLWVWIAGFLGVYLATLIPGVSFLPDSIGSTLMTVMILLIPAVCMLAIRHAYGSVSGGKNDTTAADRIPPPGPPHASPQQQSAGLAQSVEAVFRPGTGPKMLAMALGFLFSALVMVIGAGLAAYAVFYKPVGWAGLIGGGVGTMIGGAGGMFGVWHNYRHYRGRDNLMRSPHWNSLDSAMLVYGLLGAAILLSGFFSWSSLESETRLMTFFVGGMMAFQGFLAGAWRWAIRRSTARSQAEQTLDPRLMFLAAGMILGGLTMVVGVGMFLVAFLMIPWGTAGFWGWIGGACGCFFGGGGGLVGSWNTYRQLEGAPDLMAEPGRNLIDRWASFLLAIGVVLLVGAVTLSRWLTPDAISGALVVGGVLAFQGLLFLVLRSLLRRAAEQESGVGKIHDQIEEQPAPIATAKRG